MGGAQPKSGRRDKRFWRITGYDGLETIYEVLIPTGVLSEKQLVALLTCLTAKAGLDFGEIIGGFTKRGARRSHDLLHVRRHGPEPHFSCGTNPHFIAIVVDGENRKVEYPALS